MRAWLLTLGLFLAAGVQAAPAEKILADTQFNLGFNYYKAGKVQEAKGPLAKALAVLPQHPQANLLSGIIACKEARFDEGVKFLKAAQAGLPNNPDIYHNLGVAYSNLGKLADAETAFAAEQKLRPGGQHMALNMGSLALKQKKYKEAAAAFKQAAKEEPANAMAWLGLGEASDGLGDKAAGTDARLQALGLEGAGKNLRLETGQRLYEAGRLSQAAQVLEPLKGQGDAGAEFLLGVLAYRDGRFDESRERFEAALAARADYSEARFNLAITFYDQGRFEDAVSQFEEVLRLHPGDDDAKKNLDLTRQAAVRAYLKAGSQDFLAMNYLQALEKWRKAQALDAENKVVRDLVETAQAQLKLQSDELSAQAKAAWDKGGKEEAIGLWAASLERDADNAEAQRGMEQAKDEAKKLQAFYEKDAQGALAEGRLAKAREAAGKIASLDKGAGKAWMDKVDKEAAKRTGAARLAADAAAKKGDLAGQIDALQQGLDASPASAEMALRLNQAKVGLRQSLDLALADGAKAEKAGKAEEAAKQYRKALTLQPGQGAAREGLKRVAGKAKTKAADPAELDDWYYQGVYAYAGGEADKAVGLWKKVLAADGQHRLAKEALARAEKRAKALKGV
jgi:tetratricopeptide (TPR) repeat protein